MLYSLTSYALMNHVIYEQNGFKLCLFIAIRSTVVCNAELQMGLPPVKHWQPPWHGLPIHWDLHWKCTSSPRATGPPSLFHGYLDTHSAEWRHIPQWTLGSVMLPLIGAAVPQIPLSSKLKQAHQRACEEAAWRCDRERGNKKWVRGE